MIVVVASDRQSRRAARARRDESPVANGHTYSPPALLGHGLPGAAIAYMTDLAGPKHCRCDVDAQSPALEGRFRSSHSKLAVEN